MGGVGETLGETLKHFNAVLFFRAEGSSAGVGDGRRSGASTTSARVKSTSRESGGRRGRGMRGTEGAERVDRRRLDIS